MRDQLEHLRGTPATGRHIDRLHSSDSVIGVSTH